MKALLPTIVILLPSFALADSRCIVLEGSTLINNCQNCAEVTVRELRPPAEQAKGLFTGLTRTVRLEAGGREALPDGERWIIGQLNACR